MKIIRNRLSLLLILALAAIAPLQGMDYAQSILETTKKGCEKVTEIVKNNKYTIAGALIVGGGLGCYRWYQNYQQQALEEKKIQEQMLQHEQDLLLMTPLLQEFARKYAPPKKLCYLIEKHKKLLKQIYTATIDEIPEFYIKVKSDRLINAERARAVIQKHNLDCLKIPTKYIYKIDGQWIIFAEKIQSAQTISPMTLEEIKQLATFIEETGCVDWGFFGKSDNWLRDTNGKLVYIDTENQSFSFLVDKQVLLNQLYQCRYKMTPEASLWLKKRINIFNTKQYDIIKNPMLFSNTFDDQKMDFEEVKRLLKEEEKNKLK